MKRIVLLIALISAITSGLQAQTTMELSGQAGWFWSSKYNAGYGQIGIRSGGDFTLALALPNVIDAQRGIEFSYTATENEVYFSGWNNYPGFEDLSDGILRMDYYLLSVTQSMEYTEAIKPFGMFGVGVANSRLEGDRGSDNWNFAIGLGGGFKIFLSEHVGIRAQGRLLAPMNFAGLSIYCGTGGCGTGVSSFSSVLQGDFSGGLFLSL